MSQPLWDYVKAAFNARPIGMAVPPNWIGLAAIALGGALEPGIWIAGAGLELGYLMWLSHDARFRRVVDAGVAAGDDGEWAKRIARQLKQLAPADLDRYRQLESRCGTIIAQQARLSGDETASSAQADGLNRLLWIYLRLLGTRGAVRAIGENAHEERAKLAEKVTALEAQLTTATGDDLKQSLTSQLEIVRERLKKREEAAQKLAFLEAELNRIEEQVELIREQSALAGDAGAVSRRIDDVAASLGGTSEWIGEQQRLFGQVEELVGGTPPLLANAAKRQEARQ